MVGPSHIPFLKRSYLQRQGGGLRPQGMETPYVRAGHAQQVRLKRNTQGTGLSPCSVFILA